jgi:serine/threonine-protein kinase
MIGRTISHYEILEKLGEGGMGVVYKARDTVLNRDVALKFLPAGLTQDEDSRKRFVREAQAAAALDHPNICAVYEIGEADGHTFIVMSCIGGASLTDRMKRGPLNIDEALDIAIQVGRGLAKAHENGIVHRDIKPGNILITEDGLVKIVDFGLAKLGSLTKLTMVGTTMGTVSYMSPEQARGDDIDHRSDIWALGVVLYEMFTGRTPFRGEVDAAVIYSIMNEGPEPVTEACPGAPADIEEIIGTALAKEPDERFQTIDEMVTALEAVRGGESVPSVKRPSRRPAGKTRQRVAFAASAFLVIAIAIVAYFLMQPGQKIESIAVLPLMDLSGEIEEGGFADGLTGGLRSELGQISAVRWISLYSVMQFKDSHMTVPEFCEKLGVDAAVVGSIERDSSRVLLRLQLVEADSERELWSENYDRGLDELSTVYSEVALDIAEQLQVVMNRDAAAAMASRRPVDPEAHDAYLKGTYYLRNLNDLEKALTFFNKAIEADPTFAKGWAGLAETYIRMSHAIPPPEGAVENALDAVEHALELDNTLGEAYITKGHILWEHVWDQEGAKEAFRKGFEFNPSDAYGTMLYAYHLETMGRFEETADMAIKAIKLNPLSWFLNWAAFEPIAIGGRLDQALEHIDNMSELFPDRYKEWIKHGQLSLVYSYTGYYDRAIEEWEISHDLYLKTEDLDSTAIAGEQINYVFGLARLHSQAGNVDEAGRLWSEYAKMEDVDSYKVINPLTVAQYYAWQGDLDKAFECLETAYEQKNMWLTRITVHPVWEPLRGDPRYENLVKRMGLEEALKNSGVNK